MRLLEPFSRWRRFQSKIEMKVSNIILSCRVHSEDNCSLVQRLLWLEWRKDRSGQQSIVDMILCMRQAGDIVSMPYCCTASSACCYHCPALTNTSRGFQEVANAIDLLAGRCIGLIENKKDNCDRSRPICLRWNYPVGGHCRCPR